MHKVALLALIGSALLATQAAAQLNYPNRTVRIVVPATPGGGSDLFARLAAQHLQTVFGQQFVVDNRPGGGTLVGMDAVLHSPPDGHTLYLSPSTTTSMHVVRKSMPYDVTKVFAAVTQLVVLPQALVIHPWCLPRACRTISRSPNAGPGSSAMGRPDSARRHTWRWSCSTAWPAFTSSISPTAACRSRSPTFLAGGCR